MSCGVGYNRNMDLIITLVAAITIFYFINKITLRLGEISKHLRAIRLQSEIQNPIATSDELLDLDKNINFWHDQMYKYKENDKDKEIRDLTFDLFWAYVEKLNHLRVEVIEIKHLGNQEKVTEKYEDWFEKNDNKIREMEKKAMEIDQTINKVISKRNLDYEFLGKWDRDES